MTTVVAEDEVAWNNDGHKVSLRLNKSDLEVSEVVCPHDPEDSESPCFTETGCVVTNFINLYGLECNIGVCPPEPEMEICWCIQGSISDIETSQLWFVPVKDEVFYAWMSQRPME